MTKRTVYYISDGTGLTAQAFGRSLLTQFEQLEFDETTIPYINTIEKAKTLVSQINARYDEKNLKPLLFTTCVNEEIREVLVQSHGMMFDFFHIFIGPLENELKTKSSHHMGRMHSIHNFQNYFTRINAVNFALHTDDGNNTRHYQQAEFILVGVSRCGKTPTALYLALQFGIKVANYPFIPDDMVRMQLPEILQQQRHKLFGLTIKPNRLQAIRGERRPNSKYASLEQCRYEIEKVEALFKQQRIQFLDTSTRSIEEIAAIILSSKEAGN